MAEQQTAPDPGTSGTTMGGGEAVEWGAGRAA